MAVNTLAYLSQAQPYDVGPKTPGILETLSAGEGYQQKKQATKLGQKTLRDYDEDRRLKLEKATREETEAKAKALRDAQDWQQDFKEKVYDNASRQIPQLNLGNLKYFYEEYGKLGFGEETLPPFESIKTEEDVKKLQAVLTEKLRQGREMLEKDTEDVAQRRRYDRAIESGEFSGSLFDFAAQERAYEKAKAPAASPLGKLLEERDKLPADSPHAEAYDSAIKQKIQGQPNEIKLTKQALAGDEEAKAILDNMTARKAVIAKASGEAMVEAKLGAIDADGAARAVIEGRETLDNVRNTFGVPVQEYVRKKVLELDPEFNFNKPRVKLAAVKSSYAQQQKVRGAMGSFVKNLNKQLVRVDGVIQDVIKRVGIRAIDLPMRELKTRFVGSGHEKVLESYMIEISNEIGKLSTGSSASIRELSTDAQERWAKIHDVNLSFKELKHVLDETGIMANMRLESVDEEMDETLNILSNIRSPKKKASRFKIIKVE
jgi:hypothetical protein